jgi:energy-coupling factor transport system permease protein
MLKFMKAKYPFRMGGSMCLDPRVRIIALFAVGILAAILTRPILLIPVIFLASISIVKKISDTKKVLQGLLVGFFMVWGAMLSQGLFYADQPRVVAIQIFGVSLYWEGMIHGLWQSLRFIALALVGAELCLRVSPDRLLAALRRLGLPQSLALMVAISLRFIPLIWSDMLLVRMARSQRGQSLHKNGIIHWIQQEQKMLLPIIIRSWQRAHVLAESLDCRGYDQDVPREDLYPLRFGTLDLAILFSIIGVVIPVVVAQIMYGLYLWEIWYIPELRWVMTITRHWL